jgi:hypothetical protein
MRQSSYENLAIKFRATNKKKEYDYICETTQQTHEI